jgi:hypothetical protein
MAAQPPGRYDNDFTEGVHEPDRLRNVPRWMQPDGSSEADVNYDFMNGDAPRGEGGGGKRRAGTRKRAAGEGPAPAGMDDDFEKFFEQAFGGGDNNTASSAASSSFSSFSSGSDVHEGPPPRRGAKRQKESEAEEDDGVQEPMQEHVLVDLDITRIVNGETIRTSAKEREILRNAEKRAPEDEVKGGESPEEFYERCRRQMDTGNEPDAFDTDGGRLAGATALHMNCKLCRHARKRSVDMNRQFFDAYEQMINLEDEKLGYTTGAQLYIEMAAVFNAAQKQIHRDHGEAFFVTAEEVGRHFKYHDFSSAPRLILEQLVATRECLNKQRGFNFGAVRSMDPRSTAERATWQVNNTKMYMASQKHYLTLLGHFCNARHILNLNKPWLRMSGPPDADAGKREKSRHLTGAPLQGKFTSAFVE